MIWRGATGIGQYTITATGEGGCGFPGRKLAINSGLCLTSRFGDIGRTGNNDRRCRSDREGGVTGLGCFTIGSDGEGDCCSAAAMIWRGAAGVGKYTITTSGEGSCGFPGRKLAVDGRLGLTSRFSDRSRTGDDHWWSWRHSEGGVTGLRCFAIRSDGECYCRSSAAMIWRGATGVGKYTITASSERGGGFPGRKLAINGRLCLTGCFGNRSRACDDYWWSRRYGESSGTGLRRFAVGSDGESGCSYPATG